jgi:TorA maturation chaperone TorD
VSMAAQLGPRAAAPAERGDAQDRADTYGALAALLAGPPGQALLDRLGAIAGDDTVIGAAWRRLARAARATAPLAAAEEYQALFIGLTQGEVVPYGSWYRTGFLMDRPLVRLRADLTRLGFVRQDGISEPEDHAGALCEVMGLLVLQDECTDGTASAFFKAHVALWMVAFFRDLQRAPSAAFYAAVGDLGEQFLAVEARYLLEVDHDR